LKKVQHYQQKQDKISNRICYNCRQRGHQAAECCNPYKEKKYRKRIHKNAYQTMMNKIEQAVREYIEKIQPMQQYFQLERKYNQAQDKIAELENEITMLKTKINMKESVTEQKREREQPKRINQFDVRTEKTEKKNAEFTYGSTEALVREREEIITKKLDNFAEEVEAFGASLQNNDVQNFEDLDEKQQEEFLKMVTMYEMMQEKMNKVNKNDEMREEGNQNKLNNNEIPPKNKENGINEKENNEKEESKNEYRANKNGKRHPRVEQPVGTGIKEGKLCCSTALSQRSRHANYPENHLEKMNLKTRIDDDSNDVKKISKLEDYQEKWNREMKQFVEDIDVEDKIMEQAMKNFEDIRFDENGEPIDSDEENIPENTEEEQKMMKELMKKFKAEYSSKNDDCR
jgi:hypothetical protein